MSAKKLAAIWVILLLLLPVRIFFILASKSWYKAGEEVSFTTTLTTEPTVEGNGQRFTTDNSLIIWTSRFPQYHYGDRLTVSGVISEARISNQKSRMLGKIQQDFAIYFPKIELEKSRGVGLLAGISSVRQKLLSSINRTLPASSAALFSGIFLGSKETFSEDFLSALRNTGTLHVVAASGMNITMLASFLTSILLKLFHRRVAAVLVIVGICFYTALALFAPSIVRASIMGGLAAFASIFGRQIKPVWTIALTGYIMLVFDPFLLFDIGFQLSFAATSGLLLLKPIFTSAFAWFESITKMPLFGEDIATTIVAQVATLPLLLANFGSLSLVSILVNALILWTVPILMALGIAFAATTTIPIIGYLFGILALPFLMFFQTAVLFFNKPQFLLHQQIPFLAGIGYYFILIALYIHLKKRKT